MSILSQAEWLRNHYKMTIEILINHKRARLRADWWERDFKVQWEQYKLAQRLYVGFKRGVKVVDSITFEEGEG
jgi:hypothetical protein